MAYRNRQSVLPTLPKTLTEIVIPRSLTILGLAPADAVRFLGSRLHWNADGTFRTAPQLFYQSYSIHAWNDKHETN
ncbi:unnamed protein product, partial [Didymodactylos carnosus]